MPWRNMVGNRWVEIDTDAIRHNYQQIKELLADNVHVLAVVKADAYGFGAVPVAQVLEECGASMLGVTTVDEGIELREGGVTLPILLFSPFLSEEAALIFQYDLTPAVSQMEQIRALAEAAGNQPVKIHLKIETGMGRTGLLSTEVIPFLEELKQYPEIEVEGVFTHFAKACAGDAYTKKQFAVFQQVIQAMEEKGVKARYIHACNSAATLDLPEMHCNMVRVGTVLFGQNPALAKQKLELKDPWQVKTRIIHIKKINQGTSVGYGREYIAKKETRIGVIPLGWADGLTVMPAIKPKNLLDLAKMMAKLVLEYFGQGKQSTIVLGEKKYALIGRLGMQLSMVELDASVEVGDEAQVVIRRLSTNPRLPRVYFREGQAYRARLAGRVIELNAQHLTL